MTTGRSSSSVRRRSLMVAATVVLVGALATWGAVVALDRALAATAPEVSAVQTGAPTQR